MSKVRTYFEDNPWHAVWVVVLINVVFLAVFWGEAAKNAAVDQALKLGAMEKRVTYDTQEYFVPAQEPKIVEQPAPSSQMPVRRKAKPKPTQVNVAKKPENDWSLYQLMKTGSKCADPFATWPKCHYE